MAPTREEMRARLSQEVEGWNPEPGDEVFGVVLARDERTGEYDPYPYLEIDDEDTKKVIGVHAFHTVLKREIEAKDPQRGDTCGIHYFGKKAGKNGGSDYEHYKVDVYPGEQSAPRTETPATQNDTTPEPAVGNDYAAEDEEDF